MAATACRWIRRPVRWPPPRSATPVTTYGYDDVDRVTSTVDARGQALAYTYDALDRRTGRYAGSVAPANQLAGWTYDPAGAKGELAAATRYVGGTGGAAYTRALVSY